MQWKSLLYALGANVLLGLSPGIDSIQYEENQCKSLAIMLGDGKGNWSKMTVLRRNMLLAASILGLPCGDTLQVCFV